MDEEVMDPFSWEMRDGQAFLVSKEYPEGVAIYATVHGLQIGGEQLPLL